ncbi:hypothetical protein IAT38_006673 [Cryptococcus sp. DSM 104549]
MQRPAGGGDAQAEKAGGQGAQRAPESNVSDSAPHQRGERREALKKRLQKRMAKKIKKLAPSLGLRVKVIVRYYDPSTLPRFELRSY